MRTRKLAQPSEPEVTPRRYVTCRAHLSLHAERETCERPTEPTYANASHRCGPLCPEHGDPRDTNLEPISGR